MGKVLDTLATAGMNGLTEKQWVITITLDSEAPEAEADAFFEAVAETVHTFGPRSNWDPHMSASFE